MIATLAKIILTAATGFIGVAASGLTAVGWALSTVGKKVKTSLPPPPPRPARTTRPTPTVAPEDGHELLDYPRRLEQLEEQLQERHRAVQQQLQLLGSRLADVSAKGGREDLSKKYQQDVTLLDQRAASMRRVMALVWKTRAILLLRAHLAITAKKRPQFGKLPEPQSPSIQFGPAALTCHEAASRVRFYQELVEHRAMDLDNVVPALPLSAEPEEGVLDAVEAERLATQAAYAELREQMDQLADNLTYLGDHFSTLAVMSDTPSTRPDGSAERLLSEVAEAIADLQSLSQTVDPVLAEATVSNLTRDISALEEAGQEVDAEAQAHLEVERFLKRAAQ